MQKMNEANDDEIYELGKKNSLVLTIDKMKSDRELITELNESDENEEETRATWGGRFEFILSCLGYAVGLGNVWRFPAVCYENGGGAFLIPYFIFMIFVGMPMFLMELAIGQYSSQGPLTCWKMSPIFKGIGAAMLLVSAYVALYYNVIIAWSLWYFVMSFTSELPWSKCGSWATPYCESNYLINATECLNKSGWINETSGICIVDDKFAGAINASLAKANSFIKLSSSQDYLNQVSFGSNFSPGIWDIGLPRWDMVVALLVAWILIFLCLIKGVKSTGKVVYFTALFPYVVMIALLIQAFFIDGYATGISYYLRTDINRLKDIKVWRKAGGQIFFSLSTSFGGLITLSSYNKFRNNIVRDTIIVTLSNCATSIFCGFITFSYLGILSNRLGVTIDEVITEGPALIFVVYPEAFKFLPVSPLWSVLFFLMLITLGLDSQFADCETIVSAIMDYFEIKLKFNWIIILAISIAFFIIGLPMTTPGGVYVLDLIDGYAGDWNVFCISLFEIVCVIYIYGVGQFSLDIESMIGQNFCCSCKVCLWKIQQWWWHINWMVITPVLLLSILISDWVYYEFTDGFPPLYNGIGFAMTLSVVALLIFTPLVLIVKQVVFKKQPIKDLIKPSRYWGPIKTSDRQYVHDNFNNKVIVHPDANEGNFNPGFDMEVTNF